MYSSTKPRALFRELSDLLHFYYQYLVTLHLLIFAGRKQQQNCWPRSVGTIACHFTQTSRIILPPVCHHGIQWLDVSREEVSALDEWCDEWLDTDVINQPLVDDTTAVPPGFNLPRHLWTKLNHFRTGQGECAAYLARWRNIPDPSCST